MNCTKCQDTGWLCEEHEGQMQQHPIKESEGHYVSCNGAGMPCTCGAFPHKTITPKTAHLAEIGVCYRLIANKPREFWISNSDDLNYRGIFDGPQPDLSNVAHVREVIELTDEDIWGAMQHDETLFGESTIDAFEAGARWAIAKLRGGE